MRVRIHSACLQQEVSRSTHDGCYWPSSCWAFSRRQQLGQFFGHTNTNRTSGIYDSSGRFSFASLPSNLSLNVLPELPRTRGHLLANPNRSTIQVNAGSDCRPPSMRRQCGSTIKVQAGATFVGGFVFLIKAVRQPAGSSHNGRNYIPSVGTRVATGIGQYAEDRGEQYQHSCTRLQQSEWQSGRGVLPHIGVEVTLTGAALSTYFDSALVN